MSPYFALLLLYVALVLGVMVVYEAGSLNKPIDQNEVNFVVQRRF